MPVQVNRRFVRVEMLARRAKVQVVRLPLSEVVVERRPSQRRKQRHNRRERNKCADTLDHRLNSHHTKIIA